MDLKRIIHKILPNRQGPTPNELLNKTNEEHEKNAQILRQDREIERLKRNLAGVEAERKKLADEVEQAERMLRQSYMRQETHFRQLEKLYCPLCDTNYKKIVLPCSHAVCYSCQQDLLLTDPKCPQCRQDIGKGEEGIILTL